MRTDCDVVVVGGGLAGLAAAQELTRGGRRVVVLEATERCGGRVRQAISPHDGEALELGAEFLHGGDAAAKRLADHLGLRTERVFTAAHGDGGPDDEAAPDGGVAFYHLGPSERRPLPHDAEAIAPLADALEKLREMPEQSGSSPEDIRSVADFLRDEGVGSACIGLAEASYANTLGVGAALDTLPLRRTAALERLWLADGEGDYKLAPLRSDSSSGLRAMCLGLARGVRIETGWAVTSVDATSPDGVVVGAGDGRRLSCTAAIVAVPLPVLQRRMLRFEPPLPPRKLEAIDSVRMMGAAKVLLQFGGREPLWPDEGLVLHSVLCAGWPVPEIWFRRTASGGWLASGFATGSYAAKLGAMTQADAAQTMLMQLSAVLPGAPSASSLKSRLKHSMVFDWAAERWVGGGYSAPSFGELRGARATYAAPEYAGRVCFAGEATEASHMTMNAAIESGRRAAAEAAREVARRDDRPRARL